MNIDIPSLEGLESTAPDYITKLDSGFTISGQLLIKHQASFNSGFREDLASLVRDLSAIKGVHVEEPDVEIIDTSQVIGARSALAISYHRDLEPQIRKVTDEHERKDAKRKADFESRLVKIYEARFGFLNKLTDLTKVEPLIEPNYQNTFLNFYVANQGKIYECPISLSVGNLHNEIDRRISLSAYLTKEMVMNEQFRKGISAGNFPNLAGVYLVSNDSTALPISYMVAQGLSRHGIKVTEDHLHGLKTDPKKAAEEALRFMKRSA